MKITLTSDDLRTIRGEGTDLAITGTDENGDRVTFAGDRRPMGEMLDALIPASATTEEMPVLTVEVEAEAEARTYVTEVWCPPLDSGRHALHSHMPEPEPLPEPVLEHELEAEL